MTSRELRVIPIQGIADIRQGDELALLLGDALAGAGPGPGDIIAVAQKIVSKAEGRLVDLAAIEPSAAALDLAERSGKDARLAELIVRESREIIRVKPGVVVVEDHRGQIMANAGIDSSNVGNGSVLLLPEDPNQSAKGLRIALSDRFGVPLGVIITDSFGRAWRRGTVGVAIGASGVGALVDARGRPDRYGRPLEGTDVGVADSLAAAATLVMGEADEGVPCALIKGWQTEPQEGLGGLLRPRAEDMFR